MQCSPFVHPSREQYVIMDWFVKRLEQTYLKTSNQFVCFSPIRWLENKLRRFRPCLLNNDTVCRRCVSEDGYLWSLGRDQHTDNNGGSAQQGSDYRSIKIRTDLEVGSHHTWGETSETIYIKLELMYNIAFWATVEYKHSGMKWWKVRQSAEFGLFVMLCLCLFVEVHQII